MTHLRPPALPRARPQRLLPLWWSGALLGLAVSGCSTLGSLEATAPEDRAIVAVVAQQSAAAVASRPVAPAAPAAPAAPGVRTEPVAPVTVPVKPTATDPLRPDVVVKLDDKSAHEDLWQRVRRGFAVPNLEVDLVQTHEQWYAARPDYVERMTQRGSRYLFHIIEEVERRGLPAELALLPFTESAFNPSAMSSAKASGMWQFIPSTGKHFSLTQNVFRDDRRDVLASTRAALDYLEKLHKMFGDWHLALAAYNWGEGNVQRAIARNQKAGLPTDYLSLKMPAETQSYVPKLQAVKNIVLRPQDFKLTLPALENHPYFVTVAIDRDIDLDLAAKFAGMKLEEFKSLNPQMNKPVILAAGTSQVLLPYDNASSFAQRLAAHRGPMATWTAWVVPKTMRPADAAREVGMSEAELREVNHIPLRMLVRSGSTLLVSRAQARQTDVSGHMAEHATMDLAPDVPPLRKISLVAGKRDTPATIANRYRGVEAAEVARWNHVAATARFKKGEQVIVWVPTGTRTETAPTRAAAAAPAVAPAKVTAAPARTAAAPSRKGPAVHAAQAAKPAGRAVARSTAQPKRPTAARSAPRRGSE